MGTWITVWTSIDDLGDTIGGDPDIQYSVSTDAGATWSAVAILNSNAASDANGDYSPIVTTDGLGTWIATWSSLDDLGDTIDNDSDILYAVSTNDGTSWSTTTPLNTNAASDVESDNSPEVTTDGLGTWIATWHSSDFLGDTIGDDLDILYAVSTNDGTSWSSPSPLNSNADTDEADHDDYTPQIATDGMGTWIATWWSNNTLGDTVGDDNDIFYSVSTDDGATWSDQNFLNPNAESDTGSDASNQIAYDGMGSWIVVWNSTESFDDSIGEDYDILFSILYSFSEAETLNTNAAIDGDNDYSPQIATDGDGTWISVWYSYDSLGDTIGSDADILYAISTDAGMTWSDPSPLNTNAAEVSGDDDWEPEIKTDGDGTWIVIWESSDTLGNTIGSDFDILYAISTNNGASWSDPSPLNSNAGVDDPGENDFSPEIATDGDGTWIATWESNENQSGTLAVDYDIFVSVSTNDGASWSDSSPLNSNADTDTNSDYDPQITTDGEGNWVVAWESSDTLGDTIDEDDDILYSYSTDDGASWSAVDILNTNAASDSRDDWSIQIATDGAGTWIATWASFDTLGDTIGTDLDIVYAVSTDAGVNWSDPSPLNSHFATDSLGDREPQITTDEAGTWVVVWRTTENLNGLIGPDWEIAYSVSLDEGMSWSSPTVLNSNAASDSGDDSNPQITTDGNGTWVAVWDTDDDLDGTVDTDHDLLFSARITLTAEEEYGSGSDSGSRGGCFIATAAYGTPLAQDIDVLRELRDEYLLNSTLGSAFVDSYYRLSPPIADVVAQYPAMATFVRVVISPVILLLQLPMWVFGMLLCLIAFSTTKKIRSRVRS